MTKKGLALTERDQEFLVDLYDMVFLDMDYAKKIVYSSAARPKISERLKKMVNHGYISVDNIPLMGKNGSGRTKNIYTLKKRGFDEVKAIIGETEWDSRWANLHEKSPSHVNHQTMMAMVKGAYQINEGENFSFYTWLNEKRSYMSHTENKSDYIRPDGSMILKNKQRNSHAFFTFELEKSRQRPEVSINKLQRYNRFSREKGWKGKHVFDVDIEIPPRIIWVSAKKNEMLKLLEHTKDVNTDYTTGVLYTTYEEITEDPYGKIFFAKDSKDPMKQYAITDEIIKE